MLCKQGSMWRSRAAGVVLAGLALGGVAAADTIYVSTCGVDAWTGANPDCEPPDGPKATIQGAIDAAVDEDEIAVLPGTYNETIDFIGKAVRLYTTGGPQVTVIDAQGAGTVVRCGSGEGPGTVLEGFTITGGSGGSGGGMSNRDSSPTVANCTFTANEAGSEGGGMHNDRSSPTVTDCMFTENTTQMGGGMANLHESSPTVMNCTFTGNEAWHGGGGMYNRDGSSPTLMNCAFLTNDGDRGPAIS